MNHDLNDRCSCQLRFITHVPVFWDTWYVIPKDKMLVATSRVLKRSHDQEQISFFRIFGSG